MTVAPVRRRLGGGGWLAILTPLILIAGVSQLMRPGYSVDEEFTVFAVRGIEAGQLPRLPSGLLYDRGLAYSYASWLAGSLLGFALPVYRALSLLSTVAVVGFTFELIRRLTTERAAILAALLVSASIPFWAAATTGRFYAPFLATYLAVLFALANRGGFVALVALSFVCRQMHELGFTLVAVPVVCLLLDDRSHRRRWLTSTAAVVVGLIAAQAVLFVLHALEPSSGETMVRRFFLWQVLNLFERPADRQFGIVLTAMVIAWLVVPKRAALASVIGLSATAMVLAFSLARATNSAPLNVEMVKAILSEGAMYPLDMFRHVAIINPVTVTLVLAGLTARLLGAGGEWRLQERAVHLGWIGWLLWFGAIDSGITINYLLLPVSLMLAAIAVDADAITRHNLRASTVSTVAIALIVAGVALDQWRGTGSPAARLEAARPTIHVEGIDDVRSTIQPSDRVACTDELGCLLLVGRIDRWLALDDFVRERFLVKLGDRTAGVYTGAPAVMRPGDLFSPNADGTLPDRVIVVDVFKEHPIGNSRTWLPRAIELDGLQVIPLLETPQARVLQISPPERNAVR